MPGSKTAVHLTVTHNETDYALASGGGLYVQLWRKSVSVAGIQRCRAEIHEVASAPMSMLVLVEPGCAPPTAEVRGAGVRFRREISERLSHVAYVPIGWSFTAVAVRLVMMGLVRSSRRPFVEHIFSTAVPAATWLEQAQDLQPGSLAKAVAELRRAN